MIDFNFAVKPISAHRHIAAEFGLVVTIGFVNDVNHHLIVPHLFGKVSDAAYLGREPAKAEMVLNQGG